MTASFGRDDLCSLISSYAATLPAAEGDINALNVFPVADGDTGTNLRLTVDGIARAVSSAGESLADVCAVVRRAALLSAHGNSGIILSQWIRGFCKALADFGADPAPPPVVADALRVAARSARAAVGHPVEGTILTIADAAADAAAASAAGNGGMEALWGVVAVVAAQTLQRTPEMLEVLREAGVVDSGARGLELLFAAAAGHGEHVVHVPTAVAGPGGPPSGWYELTFLLTGVTPDATMPGELRESWAGLGTSVTISGDSDSWSCHIHTNDVGAAIEAAFGVGHPYRIRVEALPGPDVSGNGRHPAGDSTTVEPGRRSRS